MWKSADADADTDDADDDVDDDDGGGGWSVNATWDRRKGRNGIFDREVSTRRRSKLGG